MFDFGRIKKIEKFILIPIGIIVIAGILTLFSTTYFLDNQVSKLFTNQLIFYSIGFIVFLIISCLRIEFLKSFYFIVAVTVFNIGSLLIVLISGSSAYGAQRWLDFGIFTLQPSEVAKLALIFTTAFVLSVQFRGLDKIFNIYTYSQFSFKELIRNKRLWLYIANFLVFLLSLILILKQKSLGNSILLILIFTLIILYNFKFSLKLFFYLLPVLVGTFLSFTHANIILIILSLAIILVLYRYLNLNFILAIIICLMFLPLVNVTEYTYNNLLESYQKQRIETFLGVNNASDLLEDYNRQKSLEALGSGQLFGKGFLKGNIVNSGLLPFAYTDFAFAAIGEQFGFIGTTIIIATFFYMIFIILSIAKSSQSGFQKNLAFGIAMMILLNVIQHAGMNLGITPISGVPLPLISYGGTNVLITFIGLGIVNAINLENKEQETKVYKLEF